jgi:hypothetical protein
MPARQRDYMSGLHPDKPTADGPHVSSSRGRFAVSFAAKIAASVIRSAATTYHEIAKVVLNVWYREAIGSCANPPPTTPAKVQARDVPEYLTDWRKLLGYERSGPKQGIDPADLRA